MGISHTVSLGIFRVCLLPALFCHREHAVMEEGSLTHIRYKLSSRQCQPRTQCHTWSTKDIVMGQSKAPGDTPTRRGNRLGLGADLGRALCPWRSCRSRSRRWRSARLRQTRVWSAALPAFSRRDTEPWNSYWDGDEEGESQEHWGEPYLPLPIRHNCCPTQIHLGSTVSWFRAQR